jgi:Glu-tRNA(Gln) amidotransferase subunit E-like FAD-binding protein
MAEKMYIAYDGRAELGDTDAAQVLETFGSRFTRRDYESWKDHDAVLVEYDVEAPNTLTNENIIGHWRDGFKTLRSRCAL